jgi:N-acetylneuraminate lyase
LAQALQLKSVNLVKALQPYGVLAAGKEIMRLRGIQCGPVRPPLRKLTEDQIGELLRTFRETPDLAGIFPR